MNGNQNRAGWDGELIAMVVFVVAAVVLIGGLWGTVSLGYALAGKPLPTRDPFGLFFGIISGHIPWLPQCTTALVIVAVVIVALTVAVIVAVRRRNRTRTRVDQTARLLGHGADIATISRKHAEATATRLGLTPPPAPAKTSPNEPAAPLPEWAGIPIGVTVAGRQPLYGTVEDMHVDIWGPRSGKSTSKAIPAIVSAAGAVMATSNKRDLLDATRDVRTANGSNCWVFDPQNVAGEQPTWWWNPLSYVTDENTAAKLAAHFASGSRDPNASPDAYFEPAGQDLVADLLLAAAVGGHPITQVYLWAVQPTRTDAADLLREHGYELPAARVRGVINLYEETRSGVFGSARQMLSCLVSRDIHPWITRQGDDDTRPEFDPALFVQSRDTLYSLSREGEGTAGPLVTALTVAVCEAAERYAITKAYGRMPVPLIVVLDEAANVCRWRKLPDQYSHYGSRGILIMTILQSYAQGVEVWGKVGMDKLWSAANVKSYGGGVDEVDFLTMLSTLIGEYDRPTDSTSYSRGGRTVSHSFQRERILPVADLRALPRGRAVVFASGSRPALIRTVPWMLGPYAAQIRASIAAHDPGSAKTLAEADQTAQEVLQDWAAGEGQEVQA